MNPQLLEILGGRHSGVLAEHAVKAMGINAGVEKVTDIEKIISYGIMRTPALVVDDKVLSVGKVLTVEEVMSILKTL